MDAPVIKLEHEDSRGEIYSILLPGNKELMLLHSKAATMRGGHAHDVDELVVLLTGKMLYTKRTDKSVEHTFEVKAGEPSFNGKGVYHVADFLEDSWVLEWKIDTNKDGWKNIDYQPWREMVAANADG